MNDATRTTVYLPRALIERARALDLNVSAILRDALHQAIKTEVETLCDQVNIGTISQQRLDALDKVEADDANDAAGDGTQT